ncbi:hypothetical protein EJF36_05195 [Bacillus sp. HMF5848]|uniref:PucR family transcriptional regulator n=1 Tax=Bacillus sp. HMF5848 TaxID=2495421 RepID=UPI000F7B171E|nr:helix-turn-helix domain-containing protein [Bacillus sp. HMF5848]RSK26303.1 hypothetical protein EJF36_05195 [Bacillus sp. HMF5848]
MLEKLKNIFSDQIIHESKPGYSWFITNAGEAFAIHIESLSEKERELLSLLCQPLEHEYDFSIQQQKWTNILYKQSLDELSNYLGKAYRFTFFQASDDIGDKYAFTEAVKGTFAGDVTIIWEDSLSGFIIEIDAIESVDLTQLIDMLESDFYLTFSFLNGLQRTVTQSIAIEFQWERACFTKVKSFFAHSKVMSMELAYTYLLVDSANIEETTHFIQEHIFTDKELLTSIKTYIDCNLNVSLAAKKLFLHRNTMQYRIDKFVDRTGIDIKNFEGAAAVYLAILQHEVIQG